MNKRSINQKVLDFWYIIEFLNQPNYMKINKPEGIPEESTKVFKVMHVLDDKFDIDCILEKDNQQMQGLPLCSDCIDLCLGRVTRDECVKQIYALSKQSDKRIEKSKDSIAVLGIQISSLKRYITNSFNISPIVWAIYKLSTSKVTNLYDVINENEYKNDLQDIEDWLCKQEEINTTVLNECFNNTMNRFIQHIEKIDVKKYGVIVYKRFKDDKIKEKNSEPVNCAVLSKNFYTEDINFAKNLNNLNEITKTKYGMQFIEPYIECKSSNHKVPKNRIDLLKDNEDTKSIIRSIMHIKHSPLGKWPSRYAPAFMQQLVINLSVSKHERVPAHISVNGPPGTGKTTLLKEIIADSIVKKAIAMAMYENADDAFMECSYQDGSCINHGYSKFYGQYYKVDDKINQYSILVASSNNGAVENITKELPNGNALCESIRNDTSKSENDMKLSQLHDIFKQQINDIYFTDYANDFFNEKDKHDYYWGLVSVPLGNKKNQTDYIALLRKILKKEFPSNTSITSHKKAYQNAIEDFNKQLKIVEHIKNDLENNCNKHDDLKRTLNRFDIENKNGLLEIEKLKHKAKTIEKHINEVSKECFTSKACLNVVQSNLNITQQQLQELEINMTSLDKNMKLRKDELMKLESSRTFIDVILTLCKIKSMKHMEIERLYSEISEQNNQITVLKDDIDAAKIDRLYKLQSKKDIEIEIDTYNSNIDLKHTEQLKYQKRCNEINDKIKSNTINAIQLQKQYYDWLKGCKKDIFMFDSYDAIDDEFFKDYYNVDDTSANLHAHLCNPWINEQYHREREILFYRSLQVQKEFVLSSKCVRDNLKNLLLLWTGIDGEERVNMSPLDKLASSCSLYQTISIVTPVVSTTFASVGRFFQNLQEPYKLGTLIIDEAGQAQPHMAIGAMLRCRKAIVVGDPKQIEPVVTDDLDAIKQLLKNDDIVSYIDRRLSIQQFSDELNPIGTYYKNENCTWVGCPLVVHRRCIDPMFSISNAISYSGVMKQQTLQPSEAIKNTFALSYSQWIQCSGKEESNIDKNHFVKEQGKQCLSIIEMAFEKTLHGSPDLFVISPFSSVVDGMKQMIKKSNYYNMHFGEMDKWIEKNIGTVHTFQGKEASEVILLLGCDQDCIGTIKWVNTNIINVAVTRAKYRLCVIGDYQYWKVNTAIKTMKEIIDVYTVNELEKLKDEKANDENRSFIKLLTSRLPIANDFMEKGENDSYISTAGFLNKLNLTGFIPNELTLQEMHFYHLSEQEINGLSDQVKSHLIAAIKINSIFDTVLANFNLSFEDCSFKNILLCKATEIYVRESFIPVLTKHFSSVNIGRKPIQRANDKDFTLKACATCIDSIKDDISNLLHNEVYDESWWNIFSSNLKEVGDLRNDCCHTSNFSVESEERLIKLLFMDKTFLGIGVGKQIN